MPSELDDLRRRIDELERRLARLESPSAAGLSEPVPTPEPPDARAPSSPTIEPPVFVALSRPLPKVQLLRAPDSDNSPTTPVQSPGPVRSHDWNIERFIGGRAYAAIGAVVVVIGVGMFLKLAVERGWFSFPPAARCVSAAIFGFVLLGVGEWARRKLGAVASVGLSATGIATIYASVVAAYGWYPLLGPVSALILLAAAAVIGVVVALRAGQALLAWIALVAAYFTPLVLWRAGMSVFVNPLYLLAVFGFALTLAARRPYPFGTVRPIAWWGTVLIGTLWSLDASRQHAYVVVAFGMLVWAAVHLEMMLSAPADDRPTATRWKRRAIVSLGTTLWSAVIGFFAVHWSRSGWVPPQWMITGALFAGACTLAHILNGALWTLADEPETERERLGIALWLQSGALFIATVALAFDGATEAVSWIVLAAAAVAAARWINLRALAIYGMVLVAIAIGRLLLWESWHGGTGVSFAGLYLNRWTALMGAAVASLAASTTLLRLRAWTPRWIRLADTCASIAFALAVIAAFHERSDPFSIAAWSALVCVVIWAVSHTLRSTILTAVATAACALTLLASAMAQGMGLDRDRLVSMVGLSLGPWSAVIGIIAVAFTLGAWLVARRRVPWSKPAIIMCATGAGAAIMLAPDLPSSAAASLIVLWSAVAVAIMIGHAIWQRELPTALGVAALAAAGCAWVYFYPGGDWNGSHAPPILHPGLLLAFLLASVAAIAAVWLRREQTDAETRKFTTVAIVLAIGILVFAATSLESARVARIAFPGDQTAQGAAVSIWWGVFAAVLLVLGFARRVPAVRHVGLGMLGVATAKAVIVDLNEVSPEWRVVSFLGLGLMMLAVAVAYARVSRRLAGAVEELGPSQA